MPMAQKSLIEITLTLARLVVMKNLHLSGYGRTGMKRPADSGLHPG
jgi:hypothetical protein